ncbi:cell division topological specificity factor MinE [Neisseria sp. Ec49-e6-T10]|uniref:cell division topological specificity factor MinE n=1 Tax=Neisseria sp. Ec49-e6-T10 TaxID=3140744 RepID=UPI003EBFCC80
MSIIEKLFGKRQKSASLARERLQIIIAQERNQSQSTPDYLPTLQRELMEVLSKYVQVSPEDIRVTHEKQDGVDVLEVNIVLPENKE